MESTRQARRVEDKILKKEQLRKELVRLRGEGKKIVFTNGCFDILHVGHASYLVEAKNTGDILVLALNSDSSVRAIKGEKRPLIPEWERAYMVASLEVVDYVTIFTEETPLKLIDYLMPDILVKGGDWAEEDVVGRESVKKWGGKVVIIPQVEGVSTTNIVEKIRKTYC
jgi:rfaE bifunctional protein nucleotidyltransferase chain/domain